jgi:UPF0271 protein
VKIDLNCDMGEGCGNDAALMDYVSSANIACGYHAGDAATMEKTVEIALEKGVSIGAHPGYPDRENFGRTAMSMSAKDIIAIVTDQVSALGYIIQKMGGTLAHVKPHGALYNQAARDAELAAAIAEAVLAFDPALVLFGLSGSVSITEGERSGLTVASEVFADRTYQRDGSLTPRNSPGALILETESSVAQAMQMLTSGTVTTLAGETIPIRAETICLHGDGEHAVEFAAAIYQSLNEHNIEVLPING